MAHMRTTFRCLASLSLAVFLAACDKTPANPPPVPAPATAPAPVSAAAPAASTAPAPGSAPAAASAPAASSAAAASTTAAPAASSDNGPEIAGSVALAQGSVADTAKDGSVRQLKDGDDVYPGDSFVLGADSYLDLDLEDTGRILLRPNTTFQITSYHYEADAHDANGPIGADGQPLIKPQQPENAFFRLVKGGLRAIDGVIGHTTPQNYGVETPVATIGVRGTAFDVRYCGDDCTDEADASGKPDNGLYTSVSDGTVDVKNDDGDVVTPAGHSGFVKSRKQRMQALATPPKALRHMDLPEKLKPRAQKNRGAIQVRRQQRRQRILERRRAAAQKAKDGGRPAAETKQPKAETPRERRQQRQEEQRTKAGQQPAEKTPAARAARQHEREQRREEREQKQTAAPGVGKPAAAGQVPAQGQELTPRERRQQQRQERQQQHEQKQQSPSATTQAGAKAAQPAADKTDEARCKGKRRKGKDNDKGKDKDKCGGD